MPADRLIRLFVSSTFRDMQIEREVLAKKVFPEFRQLARSREVEFVEVDLRWGVTEEESERGETLRLCLAEIDNSRPYFLALLGERYGYVPDEIPAQLLEPYPWLTGALGRSVTEMEILHGVLQHPRSASLARFYLRDPACSRRVGGQPESAEARDALHSLKDRIRKSGHPVWENYLDADDLGRLALEDLTRILDESYPPGSEPHPLDREAAEHEGFARARETLYIGREEYFDTIDRHAAGDGPPLVVLGESGSGKSALLANWANRYRRAHPEVFFLAHYIGSTPASADHVAMLRRILGEIKRRHGIAEEIPDSPEELRAAFPNWLSMAAARGPFVLVLDALNQLEDRDGAPDLPWLPEYIPPEVRLVVSTLPGRSLAALAKRGWPTFTVSPLDPGERRELIGRYLAPYGKRLSEKHVTRLAGAESSAHPLYLRALLEELRVFGVHEELDARIDHYLAAPDAPRSTRRSSSASRRTTRRSVPVSFATPCARSGPRGGGSRRRSSWSSSAPREPSGRPFTLRWPSRSSPGRGYWRSSTTSSERPSGTATSTRPRRSGRHTSPLPASSRAAPRTRGRSTSSPGSSRVHTSGRALRGF